MSKKDFTIAYFISMLISLSVGDVDYCYAELGKPNSYCMREIELVDAFS